MSRDALLTELRAAAAEFTTDAEALGDVLRTMAEDVERALAERLFIFPVMHHSPASAAHMVRTLREREPKLVFIELCEDLQGHVDDLAQCTLPVALQAFAGVVEGHPPAWAPLSIVAPITEFSAEYQAIAYALTTPGVELVFVDRSVDHVFQWADRDHDPDAPVFDEDDVEDARLHGGAVGVEVGSVAPTVVEFRDVLLENARMSRFEEWSNLYLEEPTIGATTQTYREVMFLVGSLFRRLGSTAHHREEIRQRDRFMWTRMKEVLADRGLAPEDAIWLCGAAHSANDDVPEWGIDNPARFDIPPRTATSWSYGLIPSSFAAIELQFGHARGAVSLAEGRWRKAVTTWKLDTFRLGKGKARKHRGVAPPRQLSFDAVLRRPPNLTEADQDELIAWSTSIVAQARRNRYLASTADAIAIYETSVLLARVRGRLRPTAYDFMDAAETCLEKSRVPGRRSVRQLCTRMLGGDKVGQVGYDALPPLVQGIYDVLAAVGISATTRRVSRVLMDFDKQPELRPVSLLLWQLHTMLPNTRVARPILGQLALGHTPRQESWDVAVFGAEQRAVIQLSFEGVTVAQVLEKRLLDKGFGPAATTVGALAAVVESMLLLDAPRLTETLGRQAIVLLTREVGADDAPEIFRRVRELVHHFQGHGGLPDWLQQLVATGYAFYATQLPERFRDRGTQPDQLAAVLAFVFTLESLALALGCSRSQVVIALEQAALLTSDAEKLGLLWAAEWVVQKRDTAELDRAFAEILANPLGRTAYPRYVGGLLLALTFAPRLAATAVGLLGRAFDKLPDHVLLPWMPGLLMALRTSGDAVGPVLREALRVLPRSAEEARSWEAPWEREAAPVAVVEVAGELLAVVSAHAEAADAWAAGLGVDAGWAPAGAVASGLVVLSAHPEAGEAWARALCPSPGA